MKNVLICYSTFSLFPLLEELPPSVFGTFFLTSPYSTNFFPLQYSSFLARSSIHSQIFFQVTVSPTRENTAKQKQGSSTIREEGIFKGNFIAPASSVKTNPKFSLRVLIINGPIRANSQKPKILWWILPAILLAMRLYSDTDLPCTRQSPKNSWNFLTSSAISHQNSAAPSMSEAMSKRLLAIKLSAVLLSLRSGRPSLFAPSHLRPHQVGPHLPPLPSSRTSKPSWSLLLPPKRTKLSQLKPVRCQGPTLSLGLWRRSWPNIQGNRLCRLTQP